MSRPLRLELAGALYHITSRGNGKNLIYLQDDGFEFFLQNTRPDPGPRSVLKLNICILTTYNRHDLDGTLVYSIVNYVRTMWAATIARSNIANRLIY